MVLKFLGLFYLRCISFYILNFKKMIPLFLCRNSFLCSDVASFLTCTELLITFISNVEHYKRNKLNLLTVLSCD
jgi:hypothetical protein